MLRFLGVRHLSVIEHIEVEFEPGLNILSGETGAGKSVLVDAIDLLLGGRASGDRVRTGEPAATIQAVFERPGGREVIVRREITAQGRSRAFIDDALATAGALRDLAREVADLHGQHEHQTLLDPARHVLVLDGWADHPAALADTAAAFDAWQAAAQALDRTRLDDREKRARIDLAQFQLHEIDRVSPADDEDVALQAERHVLANADRVGRLATEAFAALYDADHAALTTLAVVWKRVADLAAIDGRFQHYVEQRNDVNARLEDLALFLRGYLTGLSASPERLQQTEDRLAALERVKRKYGPSLKDVREKAQRLREELAILGASEERMADLEREEAETRRRFSAAARQLSGLRQSAADRLSKALARALGHLAMPSCQVEVRVTPIDDASRWSRIGHDDVEVYLSPNPGEDLKPLARIASGGELSRVMLAIRTLTPPEPNRALVFDEVDAGIGGEAADAVGAHLQKLAETAQVICITHLPQIAARGRTHFRLAKQVTGGRTITTAQRLDDEGRVSEIARMIAGVDLSDDVRASARALLRAKGESEQQSKGERSSPVRQAKAKGGSRGA